MQFSGSWRDYQQRVLDEFDTHLADARIHVVAAPGSGKTVLGLELLRRLGRPALVLSPTRTIRDQWLARLVPLFLPEAPGPEDVSRGLTAPAALTTATYQALHAIRADPDPARFAALVATLNAAGPITLVLDEAHHLRREWWIALQDLVDALPDARLVALTATPPYDAPPAEWARYEAMCGPVDLEIGVPELVRNGDLCPHQDHIVFSRPGHDALALLELRRAGIAALVAELRADVALLDALAEHPWLDDPHAHAEEILETPDMLSAVLIHLAASGRKLPHAPLDLLGARADEMPLPNAFWFERLLNGLIFDLSDSFPIGDERMRHVRAVLHQHGLIEGNRVRLTESRRLFTLMAGSLAKLNSISGIARAEAANMGGQLRMLVLADHVRSNELPRVAAADYKPAKIGVVPIFETLRRAGIAGQKLGVLTGSLVLLPQEAAAPLHALARARGLDPAELVLTPVPACPGHCSLVASGDAETCVVELVTALFAAGHVTILTGTQALLGEGWDAPAVNSLVLASNSAAFMLSNQMRGRAIRIDPAHPDKVANIWHLATVEALPRTVAGALGARLDWGALDDGESMSDLALLERRFRAFEGIDNGATRRIESGLTRLGVQDFDDIDACNDRTLALAGDRAAIAERWRLSLGDASPRARVRETASPSYAPRSLAWHDTLSYLGVSALASGGFAVANALRQAGATGFGIGIMAIAGVALLGALPRLALAGRLMWRNGSLEASLTQVGEAVLATAAESGMLADDELDTASIAVTRDVSGRCEVIVHGVSRATERAVIEAVAEILGPVQNPRYLLVRTSWLGPRRRTDYHAVPAAFARDRQWAQHFHREWRWRVGSSRLVYTRTEEGRVALLRARARSFAAGFQRVVDRRSAWM